MIAKVSQFSHCEGQPAYSLLKRSTTNRCTCSLYNSSRSKMELILLLLVVKSPTQRRPAYSVRQNRQQYTESATGKAGYSQHVAPRQRKLVSAHLLRAEQDSLMTASLAGAMKGTHSSSSLFTICMSLQHFCSVCSAYGGK